MMLIEFWKPGCRFCDQINPVVESLSKEFGDKLKVKKVNTEASPNLAGLYKIKSVPTLILMEDGREIRRTSGAKSRGAMLEFLGMA